MANGISRRSLWEALRGATDRDGKLDLWAAAQELADDVESWGESDYFNDETEAPRYWRLLNEADLTLVTSPSPPATSVEDT